MAEAIKVKRSGIGLGNTFAGGKGTTSHSGCPTARADRAPGHADKSGHTPEFRSRQRRRPATLNFRRSCLGSLLCSLPFRLTPCGSR